MSLVSRSRQEFQEVDRRNGKDRYSQGQVELATVSRDFVGAVVQTVAPYEVVLDGSEAVDNVLLVSCECQRFIDGTFCEHLWASMIASDAEDPELFSGRGPLKLQRDVQDEWLPKDPAKPNAPPPDWMARISDAAEKLSQSRSERARTAGALLPRQAWFRLDVAESARRGQLVIQFWQRQLRKDGTLGKLRPLSLEENQAVSFTDPEDKALLFILETTQVRAEDRQDPYAVVYQRPRKRSRAIVPRALYNTLLPRLAATERFGLWPEQRELLLDEVVDPDEPTGKDPRPNLLDWDDIPWRFVARAENEDDTLVLRGRFERRRGKGKRLESLDLNEADLVLADEGLVLLHDNLARLEAPADAWVELLEDEIRAPVEQARELLAALWNLPEPPAIELPQELRPTEVRKPPQRRIIVRAPASAIKALLANISFIYGEWEVSASDPRGVFYDRSENRLLFRDEKSEEEAFLRLRELGFRSPPHWLNDRCDLQLSTTKSSQDALPRVASQLLAEGWQVEAKGRQMKTPSSFKMSVTSGIDWFELDGSVTFGSVRVDLPELLSALRRGEQSVDLGDGSKGLLPADMLARYGALADLAVSEKDGKMRFLPAQAALLDALLSAAPQIDADEAFQKLRTRLASFESIEPCREPRGFRGRLRPYQREGLGWLTFLEEVGLGGCLADDMGLGKTVQILALLQRRRARGRRGRPQKPSLIVAPRSVLHNWIEEADRFAPHLQPIAYTGTDRGEILSVLAELDLIVTTYGLVLRDIAELQDFEFDFVVLDEAQAIKNATSQTAKACRLLKADHRLALTGTPVENHLGELWSIFEFLNPGMLGRLPGLSMAGNNRQPEPEVLEQVAKILRPFILRRTKQEVLKDLPPKTEQTLYCELGEQQRKLYDELREHYRVSLLGHIRDKGMGSSKIQVLEALLRLRQAACHPALISAEHFRLPSAKLDVLMEQVEEILAEGHKALIFSQFTRLLARVRDVLDEKKIPYEYLDGRTRDRQQRVDRFQNDENCPLFLISLKAGGLGINLTAADYVFLLDPWWNPAVEAQAIDRAHRMGQVRPVMAYRLIAQDTVEEKIVELQKSKRDLADAILKADRSLIADLTQDDLELLLG